MKKLTKKHQIILAVNAGVLLLLLLLGGYVFTEVQGTFKSQEKVSISIESGDSVSKIIDTLKSKGVIQNTFLFKLYYKNYEKETTIQKGGFLVDPSQGYQGLIQVLGNKPNDPSQNLSITIIEGENLIEIGKKLEKKGLCTETQFLDAINKNYGFAFEKHMAKNPLKLFLNEGYAFPDTYRFTKDDTPEIIAKSMLKNFDDKFLPEYYDQMKALNLTLDQVVGLASIIQHEAAEKEEMKRVSSVFYNRLKSKELKKLQSDVTVFYARDIVGPRSNQNQKMIDAYSTYLSEGIPVGPICNPGKDAIYAALYPENTEYLYFLTDKTGKFYYAETFEKHKKYNEQAQKINESMGSK